MELKGIKENKEEILPLFIREPIQRPPKESDQVDPEFLKEISKIKEEDIQELVDSINRAMKAMNYSLQFVPDREGGAVVIKVLDGGGKIIRQIPPEAILSLSSKFGENLGFLINEKL